MVPGLGEMWGKLRNAKFISKLCIDLHSAEDHQKHLTHLLEVLSHVLQKRKYIYQSKNVLRLVSMSAF